MPTPARSEALAPPAGPAAPSSVLARVTRWRSLTAEGHRAFEQRHDGRARQSYEEALAEAEALFEAAALDDDEAVRFAPQLYCISCNDVMALASRQQDWATASIFAYRAFSRLLTVAEGPRFRLALRCRCALYLNTATSGLVQHLERDGQLTTARRHAERASAAIDLVHRLEQTAWWSPLRAAQPDDGVHAKLH